MSKEFIIQVSSFQDKIFRFALKMLNNNKDEAQDVVQDLLEKLWKMRNSLNRYKNLEALSIKMTKNLCLDRLKHEKIKIQKAHEIADTIDLLSDTNNYDETNLSEIIKLSINELPEKQRLIIHLRDVEGIELSEIADIMEIDINAVRMNLSRGRTTIKEKLIKTMNYGL